jgi:anti-sigma regulatory factor (Ser/Thr protein kinase)
LTASGQPPRQLRLVFSGRAPEVMPEVAAVAEFLQAAGCSADCVQKLELVTEEILTNVARFAWTEAAAGQCSLDVEARAQDGVIEVTLRTEDDGVAFDPTGVAEPDLDAPLEARTIGGLGLVMIRKFTDRQTYHRAASRNVFVVTKRCAPAQPVS